MKEEIRFYDSFGLATKALSHAKGPSKKERSDWYGESWGVMTAGLTTGGVGSYGDNVKEWLGKLPAATLRPSKWVTGGAGYLPNVPAYLSGSPRHMQRRQAAPSQAPVKIYIESLHSATCSDAEIAARGAAIMSLIERVRASRPVDLCFIGSMYDRPSKVTRCLQIRSNAQQMNPDALAFALCSPSLGRRLMFVYAENGGANEYHSWGWNLGGPTNPAYMDKVRETFNMAPADIHIPGLYTTEARRLMKDPAAWVQEYLDAAGITG